MLIAETVNPRLPRALMTLWIDLTHKHPIFFELTPALSQSAAFPCAYVFPNGTGDIEVDRLATGENALVAYTAK